MHKAVGQPALRLARQLKRPRRSQAVLAADRAPQGGSGAGRVAPVAQETAPQEAPPKHGENVRERGGYRRAARGEAVGFAIEDAGAERPEQACG